MENDNKVKVFDLTQVEKSLKDGEVKIAQVLAEKTQIKNELDAITLESYDDSDNMNKVHVLKQRLVKLRTPLDAERTLINTTYIAPLKKLVDDTYKNVIGEIQKVETHENIEKLIQLKEDKQAAVEAEKLAKEKVIDDKINKVVELGFIYNPNSGYYGNGQGQSIGRLDIQNMPESDWEAFLVVANQSFKIIKAKQLEAEIKSQERTARIEAIGLLGFSIIDNKVIIQDLEAMSNKQFNIDFEDSVEVFENTLNQIKAQVEANKEYQLQMSKFKAEQDEKKKAQELEAQRLKDQQAELNKQTINTYGKVLNNLGFKTDYASSLEDFVFHFRNSKGEVSVKASELLIADAEKTTQNAIDLASGYIAEEQAEIQAKEKELIATQERVELEQAKAEAEKQKVIQEALEAAKSAETAKKKKAAPSIKQIDSNLAEIKKLLILVVDPIVEPYLYDFTQKINNAIEGYNKSVEHLR